MTAQPIFLPDGSEVVVNTGSLQWQDELSACSRGRCTGRPRHPTPAWEGLQRPLSSWGSGETTTGTHTMETSVTKIIFFFSFPLDHSLADKFSAAVFVSDHYCGFAGFIFTYIIFLYPSLHSHSSFGQIMCLNTICFVNLCQNGWRYLSHQDV